MKLLSSVASLESACPCLVSIMGVTSWQLASLWSVYIELATLIRHLTAWHSLTVRTWSKTCKHVYVHNYWVLFLSDVTIIGVIHQPGIAVSLRHLCPGDSINDTLMWGGRGPGQLTKARTLWRWSEDTDESITVMLQASGPGHSWSHNGHISPQFITEIVIYLIIAFQAEKRIILFNGQRID